MPLDTSSYPTLRYIIDNAESELESSESQITPTVRAIYEGGFENQFSDCLTERIASLDKDIEVMCSYHYQGFIDCVKELLKFHMTIFGHVMTSYAQIWCNPLSPTGRDNRDRYPHPRQQFGTRSIPRITHITPARIEEYGTYNTGYKTVYPSVGSL
eukprot:sb/3473191/